MTGGLKRQLNLLAVGVILAVSLFISLAAVVAMDRLAHQLSASRMLSELSWIRFDVGDTHRILKDTGVDTLKSYLDSAQQEIIQKFRDFRIGDTGRLYLVSDEGRIVSAPSDRQATDLGGPALELVTREKVGHAKLMIAGSPSIVYFDTFPEWHWRILLVISEKEINAERDNFILIAILILLFSACAGVFVFARVANGFVLPILELAKKLSGMKEDQLGQQLEVKHRSKEVGILLSAFRRLSDRLLAAKNTLQEQNEELQVRKEELQSQNDELLSAGAMLRQSEQRHRSILHTAMDGIWLLDKQGRFFEVNETYCRMSGYSMQELLTMSISDVECLETASDTAAHLKKIMEQGEDRFESQHRRKDGSIYDVEISIQYRLADGGQFVVFLQDITESKRAKEELRESEKKHRTLFESMEQGVVYQSETGSIISANPAAERILGLSINQMQGRTSIDPRWKTIHEDGSDFPGKTHPAMVALKCGEPVKNVIMGIFNPQNESYNWVIVNAIPQFKSGENEPYQVYATLADITENKKAEREKVKLESQLQQSQKMESIGTLAGGIAHDFNNILAAILGYAEMAKDDSQPGSTISKDLDEVLEAGNRAKSLVRQILAFSRQDDTERMILQPASIVKETITMLRPSLPTTIDITQDIDAVTGLVFVDPTQLNQILMNLCTNAFHAMEETGGKLGISLKQVTLSSEDLIHEPDVTNGTFIQFSISDSGPGIASSIKDKIFDPYFTTKGVGKGTGMGLATVHGIVKSYGGFITLYSELGAGTVFHVFLPVEKKGETPENEINDQIPIGRERILFVDDEEILATMGKTMLERLGYHVTVRNNSLEALEIFQNQPDNFDIVITDQTMPGMTGSDLSRRMLQIRPDIPIILCTGYSTIMSEKKAKLMGIKEFALKPLAKKDIAKLIRKVLDV